MNIREIFEDLIRIEPKVMSIVNLFDEDRVAKTDYKPSYQRNYVWDDEKASYFIESILLGTEIPPLIFFRNGNKVEVIDGRQRYQTILRFINNEFKLKNKGLQKLENIGISNKYFRGVSEKLKESFYYTKLRIIEFSFHSKKLINDEIEEIVKKEIFKRYNSGITPLKTTDINKAAYFGDDINTYFKNRIQKDPILYNDLSSLFRFEKTNTETILKKIRQLLVLHQIPIKYYSVKKDTIISKFFDFLSSNVEEGDIELIYDSFIKKVNIIKRIQKILNDKDVIYNRLISECLFWAFSILENEEHPLTEVNTTIVDKLVAYIMQHVDVFKMDRSSFSKELHNRYLVTSVFFAKNFNIDFYLYLQYNDDFKQKKQDIVPKNQETISFEDLRINKPEPSSIAIVDIVKQMSRQSFLIRPPYQRNEVINQKKSSSIIESILLGIRLPPIFVWIREDGISEVLDGQQRLLSILGFIKESYRDERQQTTRSKKNGFSLNLKNGILKNLNGKNFDQLDQEERDKIKNFDLWIVEINWKNNKTFEPIDLFIRLNNKPYPIKEDTFEMWNSYISRDIVEGIKQIHKKHVEWFYLRKNNSRMEDENLYTSLAYLQYSLNKKGLEDGILSKALDIYKVVDKINFRIKSKNEITKVLESTDAKEDFIYACLEFDFIFIKKLKELLKDENDTSVTSLNKNLDIIFSIGNGRRTQQGFYALWFFLFDIPITAIISQKPKIRNDLRELFLSMASVSSKNTFDKKVSVFKNKYSKIRTIPLDTLNRLKLPFASLGEITSITQGLNLLNALRVASNLFVDTFSYYKKIKFLNYNVIPEDSLPVSLDDKPLLKEYFDAKPKIIIKRAFEDSSYITLGYTEAKCIVNNENFSITNFQFGYLPKFILSVLSSRIISFFVNSLRIETSKNLDNINYFTLSELRELPIPLAKMTDQVLFARIIDYITQITSDNDSYLFFERLLDTMVYELFFRFEILEAGSEVLKYVRNLPELTSDSTINKQIIEQVYTQLSDPKHELSSSLIKLLNVKEITLIEGKV